MLFGNSWHLLPKLWTEFRNSLGWNEHEDGLWCSYVTKNIWSKVVTLMNFSFCSCFQAYNDHHVFVKLGREESERQKHTRVETWKCIVRLVGNGSWEGDVSSKRPSRHFTTMYNPFSQFSALSSPPPGSSFQEKLLVYGRRCSCERPSIMIITSRD